jgi:periplasmic divalent cation tolerance protein
VTTAACIVLTTTDSEAHARAIVDAVLAADLAACVQMMPIRSFYRWKGETRDEPELLLILKARIEDWPGLEAAIRAAHTYETPEIIRLSIDAGAPDYLAWIADRGR